VPDATLLHPANGVVRSALFEANKGTESFGVLSKGCGGSFINRGGRRPARWLFLLFTAVRVAHFAGMRVLLSVIFPAALFLAAGVTAHADLVIVQKIDSALQSGNMTIKVKDGKARADIAQQVSTITDGSTGETITLMHAQKSYMRMSAERSKALLQQLQKLQGAQPGAGATPPKLTPTGRKEKVDKYDCEVFTWSTGPANVTYWIAKDFPNYAQVNAALEKTQNAGLNAVAKGMLPNSADFPGMPVKTEMTVNGQKVTTTIVSVTEEPVDAVAFEVPKDYKEMAMPAFDLPPPGK
jgi:hypothetical protein